MKNIIRHQPLHAFLIGSSIIFFLFAHNYDHVYLYGIWRSIIIVLLLSSLCFLAGWILFRKNPLKAGVFTTFILLVFFSYGNLYERIELLYYKGLWPLGNIHRYMIMLYLTIIGMGTIWIYRTKRSLLKLTKTLNAFTYTLLVFNLVIIISKATDKPLSISEDEEINVPPAHDSFPDIYYIILDGYAHDTILSSEFGMKENPLTGFLRSSGFYIANQSRTNYPSTSTSLGSSLNMNYLDRLPSSSSIYKNQVSRYLKEKGYRIIHINSGYSVTRENFYADEKIYLNSLNEFERTLLKYTVFRLDDLFGFIHYNTLMEQLDKIKQIPELKGPKFCMIHIVSPHPPYVCDESGEFTPRKKAIRTWWEPREDYTSQLKYINKTIISFLSKNLLSQKKEPVIIIQSDHGPWIKDDSFEKIYEARSQILNAYKAPGKVQAKLYEQVSPVNSFRILFNGLFKDSLPLLNDIPLDPQLIRSMPQMHQLYQEHYQ